MSQAIRIFVPRDTAAIAVGADAAAAAIAQEAQQRGLNIDIVRNGSRGLLWLETLVEVETPAGRVAYGPVDAADVAGLFDAGWLQGKPHPLSHGLTEDIPYLKNQERLTFARVGITDPLSLADYQAHGGLQGLQNALAMEPRPIVDAVVDSGLADAAAPHSRPASNGKPYWQAPPIRNTSSAMRTKAIPARFPTAC